MKDEVEYQRDIVNCVNKELNGFAFKLSNAFTVGIPDLYIHWHLFSMLVEVKVLNALPVRDTDTIKPRHPVTALQAATLRDHQKVGGCSGLIILKPTGVDLLVYGMRATFVEGKAVAAMPTKAQYLAGAVTKKRGEKLTWPVEVALQTIATGPPNSWDFAEKS